MVNVPTIISELHHLTAFLLYNWACFLMEIWELGHSTAQSFFDYTVAERHPQCSDTPSPSSCHVVPLVPLAATEGFIGKQRSVLWDATVRDSGLGKRKGQRALKRGGTWRKGAWDYWAISLTAITIIFTSEILLISDNKMLIPVLESYAMRLVLDKHLFKWDLIINVATCALQKHTGAANCDVYFWSCTLKAIFGATGNQLHYCSSCWAGGHWGTEHWPLVE